MSVICEIDYNDAKKYVGKNVTTKVNNKKQKVYFKLNCDNLNLKESINFVKANKNFICVNYIGQVNSETYQNLEDTQGVYIIHVKEVGNNISDVDIEQVLEDTPKGVIPIIKLPEDFSDLRKIWDFSRRYKRVRFCGGDLFNCDGCRLGCCGIELMKSLGINEDIKEFNKVGCSCFCDVYDFEDLDLTTTNMSSRSSSSRSTKNTGTKKPKVSFSELMKAKPLSI